MYYDYKVEIAQRKKMCQLISVEVLGKNSTSKILILTKRSKRAENQSEGNLYPIKSQSFLRCPSSTWLIKSFQLKNSTAIGFTVAEATVWHLRNNKVRQ